MLQDLSTIALLGLSCELSQLTSISLQDSLGAHKWRTIMLVVQRTVIPHAHLQISTSRIKHCPAHLLPSSRFEGLRAQARAKTKTKREVVVQ